MISAGATVLAKKVLGLRIRTWLLLILAAPFLVWGLLNVVFSTAIGTGILEGRIEKKVGLPCEIGSVTWSPWAGVSVREFELFDSEESSPDGPILRVGEVNLDLSWSSLMKGEKRFERLEVVDVLGELSLEQLKGFLKRYQKSHPAMVVDASQKKPPPAVKEKPKPQMPKAVPVEEKITPVQPQKAPEKKGADSVVKESVPVDDFEGTVVFQGVNLRIYSQEQEAIDFNLRDCGATVPVWGAARDGELRVGVLEVGDCIENLERMFPLRWDGDSIVIDESEVKLFGLEFEIAAEMRVGKGLPVGVRLNFPDQQMDLSPIYPDRRAPLEVAHLSSRNFFQGYLSNLGSFTGRSVTQFTGLVFHDPKDGGDTEFERGSAVMTLSSAGIVANDIRAIGEEDAVLMNGYVTTGGEAAATLRIVSSPGRADSHEKRIRNTSPELSLKFSPLVTPDREFRDIRIESQPGGLAVDLGVDEEWVPLIPLVRAVLGGSKSPKPPLP